MCYSYWCTVNALEVNYAQFVCEYVDKFLQQDYDKHLIEQAERYEY